MQRSCADTTTRCDLSRGIATDDVAHTVTFHLRAPDPGFLFTLCSSLATPAPLGTPFRTIGFRPIPGTGPYKIASANRNGIHYVRNPYFREWSHSAQPDGNPDRIVWRFGLSAIQEVREIEQGHADWMADGVPGALLPEIETRFAGQFHTFTNTETDFLQINTTLPPFTDRPRAPGAQPRRRQTPDRPPLRRAGRGEPDLSGNAAGTARIPGVLPLHPCARLRAPPGAPPISHARSAWSPRRARRALGSRSGAGPTTPR